MCPSVVDAASRRPLLRSLSLYAPVRGQPPRFSLTSAKDPRAVEREGTNGAEGGMYIAFHRCFVVVAIAAADTILRWPRSAAATLIRPRAADTP